MSGIEWVSWSGTMIALPLLLVGGALLRNAAIDSGSMQKRWIDFLCYYLAPLAALYLLLAYPVLIIRKGHETWPYLTFVAGLALLIGSLVLVL